MMIKFALLTFFVSSSFADTLDCGGSAGSVKIAGCYKKPAGLFNKILIRRPIYQEGSIKNLACDCIAKAKKEGSKAIALGDYEECRGTTDTAKLSSFLKDNSQVSNKCFNANYQSCTKGSHCMGEAGIVYIYSTAVDGGWGDWSSYGGCSKTCGGGKKIRTRKCDRPKPQNGGANCVGISSQATSCNTKTCAVNGNWGRWSSYGGCSKTCGGGSRTRTRRCDSPKPQNGGASCKGSSTQSGRCNIQKCLPNEACTWAYTNWNDDGKGGAVYLDRHDVRCNNGQYIKYMKLERKKAGWFNYQIRYKYICCQNMASCSSVTHSTLDTYNGGFQGNAVYFDRQTVSCGRNALQRVKLVRHGNNIRYDFTCCKKTDSTLTTSCYASNTGFNDDGRGNAAYLDRHAISCSNNYYLTYFHLKRNSAHNKYRYDYQCCKINPPSPRN
ncbi:uncharacterized protein [Clytia hemisphaerica]|uniref:Cnidarian restricted protein n=1 Tax=Clytia hemisphaerica TaxID=252671 RepID=A0A7M5V4H1_9CNID|eukprot:TCONS_00073219-protein